MTKYVILSERIGTPGDEFDAEAAAATGINVDALVAGGFISTATPIKSGKKEIQETKE